MYTYIRMFIFINILIYFIYILYICNTYLYYLFIIYSFSVSNPYLSQFIVPIFKIIIQTLKPFFTAVPDFSFSLSLINQTIWFFSSTSRYNYIEGTKLFVTFLDEVSKIKKTSVWYCAVLDLTTVKLQGQQCLTLTIVL